MTVDRKQLETDIVQFVQARGARYTEVTLRTDLL